MPELTAADRQRFARRRSIIGGILVFLLIFTGYFGWHTVQRARYWHEHRDEPIRSWMTIGYIAHSYHVSPTVLKQALGLPVDTSNRRPLARIAHEQNRTADELISILNKTIETERQQKPPPQTGGGM